MSVRFQVTFDAGDPEALSAFWAEALGYVAQPPPPGYESWEALAAALGIPEEDRDRYRALVDPDGDGPRLFFQRVPEGKTAKNRVHLDLAVGGGHETPEEERRAAVAAVAARHEALGATRVAGFDRPEGAWVTMRDPEGNEYCLQ